MKAAAILALLVAIAATVYLLYESILVREKYKAAHAACSNCTAVKEAVADNWRAVQSNIEALKNKGKYREAEKFAREHAREEPSDIIVPCMDCDVPPPDYSMPSTVAVVGFIASRILFGAVKPKRYFP